MTMEEDARFIGAWETLMDKCNARPEPRVYTFAQLLAAYSEPHRHYHNLQHIIDMFDRLPWLQVRKDPDMVLLELATWYHDVVYDPRSSENESRSAAVARNSLLTLGVSEDRINRVCDLILMTKDHQAPPEDKNAQLFLDGDLSILGMHPDLYHEYSKAIRQEYAWVPDKSYYPARLNILQELWRRPKIFRSVEFSRGHWEEGARRNITCEIGDIDAILRNLAP